MEDNEYNIKSENTQVQEHDEPLLNQGKENKLSDAEVEKVKNNEVTEKSSEKNPNPKNESNTKTTIFIVLIVILMIASIVGVFVLVKILTAPKEISETSKPVTNLSRNSTEILFTKQTLPRVDASLATQPLMDAFVKNFTGETTEALGIEYTNTHPAYVKLINNETDLIIVTEPSNEEKKLAEENNIVLDITKVVNEGFVFFVNKDNPVDNVSFEDLVKIYKGEITNWKELGGNDAEIVAYQRPENSGSQTGLYNLVLKGEPVKVPTVKESVTLSMAGIVDYVANYENSADALGYGFYYYVNTMYKNDNLKYLAIDRVKPTYETIQNGTYPILSAYYIVTRAGDTNRNTQFLKEAMLSQRGQLVASEAGYVPAE